MKSSNRSIPILFLLAMALALHAQSLPASLAATIEPNMTLSSQTLASTGSSVQLVSLDGVPTFLVIDGQLIEDPARIQSALEADVQLASNYSDALNQTRAELLALQTLRAVPEAKCAQYLAVDRFPCYDKTSCVKAAQANPQTSALIHAEGFWEAMVGWQASRLNFNESLAALDSTLQYPTPTRAYADSLRANLSATRAQFDSFMHNNLYRTRWDADCNTRDALKLCFEFCARANWTAESSWVALESRWAVLSSTLSTLDAQPVRAQALADSTAAWLNYSKNRKSLWSDLDATLTARQRASVLRYSASSPLWSDPALASDLMAWEQAVNDTRTAAASGRLHAALASGPVLINQSTGLDARMSAHQTSVTHINNSLQSIRLAVSALERYGSNQSQVMAASLAALEKAAAYPIAADSLSILETQAASLEQLALAEAARAQLNAPASAQNVSAAAQAIVSVGANGTNGSNASAPASANASASSKPGPLGLPCALPIGLVAALLLLSILRPIGRSD